MAMSLSQRAVSALVLTPPCCHAPHLRDQTEGVKMLAYLVPVLQRMHDTGTAGGVMGGAAGRPSVVILAPTTELARQVGTVCKKLAGGSGLPFRTYVATGGGGTAAAAQNSEGGMSISGALRELRKVRGSSGIYIDR